MKAMGPTLRSVGYAIVRLPRWFGMCLITFYRSCISPRYPSCCRYIPSCSQYALVAVERFGLVRGVWLAARRIMRCHPLHDGGYDPVPEVFSWFGTVSMVDGADG